MLCSHSFLPSFLGFIRGIHSCGVIGVPCGLVFLGLCLSLFLAVEERLMFALGCFDREGMAWGCMYGYLGRRALFWKD